MPPLFEEIAWAPSDIGELVLRRRHEPVVARDVYEVKVGDEFLMSSLFTVAEEELARLGLATLPTDRRGLSVLVGGLGLGYTARAVLEDDRVATVEVVDAVGAVIDWHRRDLLPDTVGLAADPRVTLTEADFFAMVADGASRRRYDAVLVDIDHTPRHVLAERNAAFYTADGLGRLRTVLEPDGVFGLWSDDPPDEEFTSVLGEVFTEHRAEVVSFPNPLTGGTSANTVYVATGLR